MNGQPFCDIIVRDLPIAKHNKNGAYGTNPIYERTVYSMTDKKEMLGNAPVGKLLFKLAIPTVIAQLINMLYNIVDRIYIGHIPEIGDLALTGVGVCMPIIMIVSAFAALVSSGGAPRASIFMGKKDVESAEKALGGCFGLQLIVPRS